MKIIGMWKSNGYCVVLQPFCLAHLCWMPAVLLSPLCFPPPSVSQLPLQQLIACAGRSADSSLCHLFASIMCPGGYPLAQLG